jgi:8-oxo-dGTP diphosphatase
VTSSERGEPGRAAPAAPGGRSAPAAPTGPAELAGPAGLTGPAGPAGPAAPGAPAELATSAGPAEPAGPAGLADYDPRRYPPVAVTADLVVLTVRDDELAVLLVRRGEPPFAGEMALPGGFVRPDETLREAAVRELAEETGPGFEAVHLEQLASYGDPGRDPRMRVVTVAYLGLAPALPTPRAGSDAAEAAWVPVAGLLGGALAGGALAAGALAGGAGERLAFDHDRILADGVERARAKLEYTPLATAFCPPEFTVGQLRRVYEIVWGVALDPRNFHRKITGTAGFLRPAGGTTVGDRGRPAQLYRRGDATALQPPMLRTTIT